MEVEHAIPGPQGWMNVVDGVFHNARRRPRHPALEQAGRTVDYAELAGWVDRTAAVLAARGTRPGELIGVALGDDIDHVVALLAVAWMGAVILPMDVRWTTEEKRRIAGHFGARRVLVSAADEPIPDIDTIVCDEAWQREVADSPGGSRPVRSREQPLVLSLSSGTTGTPKGPLVTHGHILSRLYIYSMSLTFNEADRFMTATPLYFGGGRYMTLAYLFMGATVVLHPPPYAPSELAQAIVAQRISGIFLVPTLLRRLLELPKAAVPLFPNLRLLISAGSVLFPEERRAVMHDLSPGFFNFYSSTEGGGISLLRPEHPDSASMSVGQVVFGAEVQVVDDAHRPAPTGTVGAIRYRGGSVADAFYRNPEASAEAFRDGWYYPGDLGRFDDDGFLYLTGRSKDMIIRGGVNIYPAEVEQALAAHRTVAEAAVVGWPSRTMGEEVAAFVVCRAPISEAELIDECRKVLAPYKVPRAIHFVDDLPKTGIGKVIKQQLVARLVQLP